MDSSDILKLVVECTYSVLKKLKEYGYFDIDIEDYKPQPVYYSDIIIIFLSI